MSPLEILNIIEILRMKLVSLAQNKPLIDPEVVKQSQILDLWLNLYDDAQSWLNKDECNSCKFFF